jgi:hypothetical protein
MLIIGSVAVSASGLGGAAIAGPLMDGSFEGQGASVTSWSYIGAFSGPWSGGGIGVGGDYQSGWKNPQDGRVFGIVKDRQSLSQQFVADITTSTAMLMWYDTNRPSWRGNSWYGRPNTYSVTITDSAGGVQSLYQGTSQVAGGLESNSNVDARDDRWSPANLAKWDARSSAPFSLVAGSLYTLSFNSLATLFSDGTVDDRTTFLDNIVLTTQVPVPGAFARFMAGVCGIVACARKGGRRRR